MRASVLSGLRVVVVRPLLGALAWAATGAALGAVGLGLYGLLCGLLWWALRGDPESPLTLAQAAAAAGLAAGAVTGAAGRLIDGRNPLARDGGPDADADADTPEWSAGRPVERRLTLPDPVAAALRPLQLGGQDEPPEDGPDVEGSPVSLQTECPGPRGG